MTTVESPISFLDRIETMLAEARAARNHGPALGSKIDNGIDLVSQLKTVVLDIESYQTLNLGSELRASLDAARRFWQLQPTGCRLSNLSGLVSISPTLADLTKAGFRFVEARRNSPEQIDLACAIADTFAECPHYLWALRNPKLPKIKVSGYHLGHIATWLRSMADRGLARDFTITGTFRKKPTERDLTTGGSAKGAQSGTITKGTFSPEVDKQVRGGYLEGYAEWIANNLYESVDEPHEVYTNLTYTLPRDLGGGSSEIDVLVRTESTLTMIECKTGRITMPDGSVSPACRTAIHNAERFEHVAQSMGLTLTRRHVILRIARPKEDTEELTQAIANASSVPIELWLPGDVRREIQAQS